jgi:uncharacterized protein YggE
MKFLKLTLVALFIPAIIFAQSTNHKFNELRTIEVVGSASTSLPPNIIVINFVVKEYTSNAVTVSIEATEDNILKTLKTIGVPSSNLSIMNIYGYTGFSMGETGGRYEERRMYSLRFKDVAEVAQFKERINPYALESFNIVSAEHDDLTGQMYELKERAIKAGKDKACFLLKSLGEECGRVLHIVEVSKNITNPYAQGSDMTNHMVITPKVGSDGLSSKGIQIDYQVKLVFEIK